MPVESTADFSLIAMDDGDREVLSWTCKGKNKMNLPQYRARLTLKKESKLHFQTFIDEKSLPPTPSLKGWRKQKGEWKKENISQIYW